MEENTPFSALTQAFFRRVEADGSFFNYIGLTDEQAAELAEKRANAFLKEACAAVMLGCRPSVNFFDYDEEQMRFNFALNQKEIFLLSSIMYLMYINRDIARLKTLSVNYTSADLKVFDPSNARKSFHSLYTALCEEIRELKNEYGEADRDTGELIGIDFGAYEGGGK